MSIFGWLWAGRKRDELDDIRTRLAALEFAHNELDAPTMREDIDNRFEEVDKQIEDLTHDVGHLDESEMIQNIDKTIEEQESKIDDLIEEVQMIRRHVVSLEKSVYPGAEVKW